MKLHTKGYNWISLSNTHFTHPERTRVQNHGCPRVTDLNLHVEGEVSPEDQRGTQAGSRSMTDVGPEPPPHDAASEALRRPPASAC